jgi:hypothetical protein
LLPPVGRASSFRGPTAALARTDPVTAQSDTPRPATADLAPPCPGDWNTDGGVDGADLEAFFASWEAGEADANRDGGTDGADVETFMIAWEAGGC